MNIPITPKSLNQHMLATSIPHTSEKPPNPHHWCFPDMSDQLKTQAYASSCHLSRTYLTLDQAYNHQKRGTRISYGLCTGFLLLQTPRPCHWAKQNILLMTNIQCLDNVLYSANLKLLLQWEDTSLLGDSCPVLFKMEPHLAEQGLQMVLLMDTWGHIWCCQLGLHSVCWGWKGSIVKHQFQFPPTPISCFSILKKFLLVWGLCMTLLSGIIPGRIKRLYIMLDIKLRWAACKALLTVLCCWTPFSF